MEDVVAIKITDRKKGQVAFLTWGRVFDRTDPKPLEKAVANGVKHFGFVNVISIAVCDSLQEVRACEYFFEGLIAISWRPIRFKKNTYKPWAEKMRKSIARGKELYFLGRPQKLTVRRSAKP